MKKYLYSILLLLLIQTAVSAQALPPERKVDWYKAGLTADIPTFTKTIYFSDYGGLADGSTNNTIALNELLSYLNDTPTIVMFDSGIYIFHAPINIPNNVILRGLGAAQTTLRFDNPFPGHLLRINGSMLSFTYRLSASAVKGANYIVAPTYGNISVGDYIKLSFKDAELVTSDWALNTVGQIAKVVDIRADTLFLSSTLRLNYDTSLAAKIQKILPAQHIGIECLSIERVHDSENQSCNIYINNATNVWMDGIESSDCVYAHIGISNSTNVAIRNSYFHDAFSYGNGGKAYGVMVHLTSNECLIENNIFRHLRHSMIVQAGANANVFAYNYSIEPHWTEVAPLPENSAGDMVLHGNYAYANLFEGNIGQHIVIDDSHGQNGPYNTFYRNRAELYGIFMNNSPASDSQNFIGNEVTHTGILMGNYVLNGSGHFEYSNNIKGSVVPAGTLEITDTSLYLLSKPAFLATAAFPNIGYPAAYNTEIIPAASRYQAGIITICNSVDTGIGIRNIIPTDAFILYPNPASNYLFISDKYNRNITTINIEIINSLGKVIYQRKQIMNGSPLLVPISTIAAGNYWVILSRDRHRQIIPFSKR